MVDQTLVNRVYSKNLLSILLFLLICLSGSLFQVLLFKPVILLLLALLIFFNLDFIKFKINGFYNYFIIIFTIPVFLILFNYLFTKSTKISLYIALLIQLFLTYFTFITLRIHNYNFEEGLFKTLKVICIHSLIGFFLSQIMSGFLFQSANGYRCFLLFPLPFIKMAYENLFGFKIWRNQGIFWEPGILQIYLNLFLFFSLFKYEKKKDIILSLFAIFTTLSTTGLAIACIQILFYIQKSRISFFKKISFLLFAVLFGVAFLFSFISKRNDSETRDITSYSLRIMDITDSIYVVKKYPFTGIGIDSDLYSKEKENNFSDALIELIGQRGNSNGIASLLYQFGIPIFILVLCVISKQTIIKTFPRIFFLLFFLGLCNEPLMLTPFFMLFPISSMEKIKLC